ncbi:unnamed protein product [Phaeothamnion confervicola]
MPTATTTMKLAVEVGLVKVLSGKRKRDRSSVRTRDFSSNPIATISSNPSPEMAIVFDPALCAHAHPTRRHPEKAERITSVLEHLRAADVLRRCAVLGAPAADDALLEGVHNRYYLARLARMRNMKPADLQLDAAQFDGVFFNQHTVDCARRAAGGLATLVEAVVAGRAPNGLALIRPPGHHAEAHAAKGFCVLNNVAVAAAHARRQLGVRRVLVVDWDVHHGNGTQRAFLSDPSVLYFSIHRYDGGRFYPGSADAAPTAVGAGAGRGYTVNVAWDGPGMGDAEYLETFRRVLLPAARRFQPELVLVSAGFDAAAGDPLGGCEVTPAGFGTLAAALAELAGGRVVLALEGGYSLSVLRACVLNCARALLRDPHADLYDLGATARTADGAAGTAEAAGSAGDDGGTDAGMAAAGVAAAVVAATAARGTVTRPWDVKPSAQRAIDATVRAHLEHWPEMIGGGDTAA